MENFDEDAGLVACARAGDSSAFDTLSRKYRTRLTKIVGGILFGRAEVEDAVQETLLKAYCGLSMFREESSFYTWLYRIALNCAFSARSSFRRGNAQIFVCEESSNEISMFSYARYEVDGPLALLECKERLLAIDSCLNKIPEVFSATLLLRELEGLTYEEIADLMNCSVGTVRSRLFRARQLLSSTLT